jgi:hypothetical protein
VVRRLFGLKGDECGRFDNEELNDLLSLPDNIRVITERRMRWAAYQERILKRTGAIQGVGKETERKGAAWML